MAENDGGEQHGDGGVCDDEGEQEADVGEDSTQQQHASAGEGVHVCVAAVLSNCALAVPSRIVLGRVPSHSVHASSPSLVPGLSPASLCLVHPGFPACPSSHTRNPAFHLNYAKGVSLNLRAIASRHQQAVHQVHHSRLELAKSVG